MSNLNIWILLGALFLIFEVLSTSFFAFFFGIGALITGFLVWGGIINNGIVEVVVFAVSSLASLGLFRDRLKLLLANTKHQYNDMIGEKAKVIEAVSETIEGKVFFRGTEWQAISRSNQVFEKDQMVKIVGTEGIKLVIG